MMFINFRMDSESEIRNISKDVEQKWGASGVRRRGGMPRRSDSCPRMGGVLYILVRE